MQKFFEIKQGVPEIWGFKWSEMSLLRETKMRKNTTVGGGLFQFAGLWLTFNFKPFWLAFNFYATQTFSIGFYIWIIFVNSLRSSAEGSLFHMDLYTNTQDT